MGVRREGSGKSRAAANAQALGVVSQPGLHMLLFFLRLLYIPIPYPESNSHHLYVHG